MDRRAFIRNTSGIIAAQNVFTTLPHNLFAQSRVTIPDMIDKPLKTIAFGSCNKQDKPQDHWYYIRQQKPDLWLWLGDNIYADKASPEERFIEYQKVKNNQEYIKLAEKTGIMGIWDDHDFYSDNSNGSYPEKEMSQQLFADFLDIESDHPIRFHEGIYRNDIFGPVGQQTQIVSLDLRYFKKSKYDGGLLGEVQWNWLSSTLRNSTADLLIICTSIHLTSRITGFGLEGWNTYPEERERLYDLLAQIETPILVLSGDRHMAEIIKKTLDNGKPIYEIMSSSLTHTSYFYLPDSNRIGNIIGDKNYGLINVDWSGATPQVKVALKSATTDATLGEIVPDFSY